MPHVSTDIDFKSVYIEDKNIDRVAQAHNLKQLSYGSARMLFMHSGFSRREALAVSQTLDINCIYFVKWHYDYHAVFYHSERPRPTGEGVHFWDAVVIHEFVKRPEYYRSLAIESTIP